MFAILLSRKEILKARLEGHTKNLWEMYTADMTLIFKNTENRKLFIVINAYSYTKEVSLCLTDYNRIEDLRPIQQIVDDWYTECLAQYKK